MAPLVKVIKNAPFCVNVPSPAAALRNCHSGYRPGLAEFRNNSFVCMLSHRARYIMRCELCD
jgi:hypothetical protein